MALPLFVPLLAVGALALLARTERSPSAGVRGLRGARVGYNGMPANTAAPETQPTRPSCTECVEKHLGAAWILMTEHRDGYPHRLRAIGHLHEAEDESQHWPALHVAIREARKLYQQEGKVPDFAALVALIEGIHQGTVESV